MNVPRKRRTAPLVAAAPTVALELDLPWPSGTAPEPSAMRGKGHRAAARRVRPPSAAEGGDPTTVQDQCLPVKPDSGSVLLW